MERVTLSSVHNTFLCLSTLPPALEVTHSPLEPPSTLDTCPQPSRPYFYPSSLSISPCPHHPLLCTPQLPWRYVHFTTTTDLATCSSHPTSRSRQLRSLCSQSPPPALPSRMHPPRVAQHLFPNQKCECPTPPHPQPLLLSPEHSRGIQGHLSAPPTKPRHCPYNLYPFTSAC